MKILISILIILSAFIPETKAANDFNLSSVNYETIKDWAEFNIPLPEKPEEADWLIMVYMNGKSNIEPFALHDLNRFETVGSTKKIKIVAELGRSKGFDNDTAADGDWTGVRRYLVKRDNDPEKINSLLLADLGDRDMGDWKEAADFMLWAKKKFSAKKYMLIIWDHGWGWIDPVIPSSSLMDKSISHDFASGHYIKTTEIKNIFQKAGSVDLYASMACFMQMAEVAYEIKDYASVIVGSEEVIQLPSFNFEDFFSLMLKNPQADSEKAGKYLVGTFKEMYSRPEYLEMLKKTKYGVQLSAIKGEKLAKFAELADAWAKLVMKTNDTAALKKAKKNVLRFEVGDETTDPDKQISFYGDLYNFAELAAKNLNPSLAGAKQAALAAKKLMNFIKNELVIKNVFLLKDRTGKDYSNTHGISAHIPGKPGHLIDYEDSYSKLDFSKATVWNEFIKYLKSIN